MPPHPNPVWAVVCVPEVTRVFHVAWSLRGGFGARGVFFGGVGLCVVGGHLGGVG